MKSGLLEPLSASTLRLLEPLSPSTPRLLEPLSTSTPRQLEPLSGSTPRLLEPLSSSTPRLLEPLSLSSPELDVAARYKKIKTKTGEGTRAYRSLRSNTSENLSAIPQASHSQSQFTYLQPITVL